MTQTIVESFTVTRSSDGRIVTIHWKTSAEAETVGFFIYRAQDDSRADFIPISGLIESKGAQGGEYQYIDDTIEERGAYIYMLVEKKHDGSLVDYEDIVEGTYTSYQIWLPLVER